MINATQKWPLAAEALLVAALFTAGLTAADESAALVPPGVKTKPVQADWLYSRDGGKTFAKDPPAGAPAAMKTGMIPLVFRGTFEIEDPARAAGLWIRIAEPGATPRAAICNGDLTAAAGGYWKDLGFCPTLLNARVALNGKQLTLTHGPMLYFWLPVEGELVKGKNTIELAGDCYTYWNSPPAETIVARLLVAEPQPAEIYNGPLLGDLGDGYFTLACRTRLPAELTVEAAPAEQAGKPVTATSPKKIWHRLKVQVPAGTKGVRYSLKSKVGPHESTRGPFTVRFPGEEFRFVALGNVTAHPSAVGFWAATTQRAMKLGPTFILHTGNCSEHGTWEFDWERRYFAPAGQLLASVPTLITPCSRDFAGAVQELHYTPAADTYTHSWSKVVGPVRFIGLDGNRSWKAGADNYVWLEKELGAAKEKFVFVLDAYPGYTSGKSTRKLYPWIVQTREAILPLLGKYKATALISGWDPGYERCEPTPDKGCTQIVTGAAGKEAWALNHGGLNPFGEGKGRDWAGAGCRSFCVFEVKPDAVELRAVDVPADPAAEPKVLDKKTFRPR